MKRIDFLGADGIDKEAVYEAMVRHRDDAGDRWQTRDEARRRLAAGGTGDERGVGQLLTMAACYIPRLGDLVVDRLTQTSAERAFVQAGGDYQRFFEHCLHHSVGIDAPDAVFSEPSRTTSTGQTPDVLRHVGRAPGPARSDRIGIDPDRCVQLWRLFDKIKEVCLLRDHGGTVVFRNSLADCAGRLFAEVSPHQTVRPCFEKMPTPDVVVHLTAPADDIADNTGGALPDARHRLRVAEIGASALGWAGADVITVDATEEPNENVHKIAEVI